MIVALPRRQPAGVGGPHALQRHRRRALARRGAVEVLDEVVVAQRDGVRNRDARGGPELRSTTRRAASGWRRSRGRAPRASAARRRRPGRRRRGVDVTVSASSVASGSRRDAAKTQKRRPPAVSCSNQRGAVPLAQARRPRTRASRGCPDASPRTPARRRPGCERAPPARSALKNALIARRRRCARGPSAVARFSSNDVSSSAGRQRDLHAARRDLRRMEAVVRLVEDPVELVVLPRGHELAASSVVEPVPLDAVGRALVPQVAAVERQAKPRALAPQQAAEQAVAERDGLVPAW